MILGIDVGNCATKVHPNINFKSSVETTENILGNKYKLEIQDKELYIGENNLETFFNKADKNNFIPLMITAILLASNDVDNKIVVGLPVGQHKENKEKLKERILNYNYNNLKLNGVERKLRITACEVYPESLATYYLISEDCIIVDIGGRSTDICYISSGKLIKYSTLALGTLNIYSEISKYINNKYALNTDLDYAEKIINQGYFKISGVSIDISFIKTILKNNFEIINRELELNYPIRIERLVLTGGGGKIFELPFKKRYKTELIKKYIFSNSIGFKKVGEMLWL